MKPATAIMAAMALLAGCTVGPDYRKPAVDAPAKFVSQEVLDILNTGKEAQPLAADWWSGFHDPVLNQLVASGLESNFQIAAAVARVSQAEAGVRLADAEDNLSATANVDAEIEERQELSGGGNTGTEQLFGALSAVLPLDIFGGTRRSVEAARADLEASREALKAIVLGTSAEITGEYLRLRGNQRQLELLRESVELQEKTLSIVRARFEAGISPELDLQRAITTVENLRSRIPPLVQALQNARNRLASLTGRFSGAYEQLLSKHEGIPFYQNQIPQLLPLDVLETRPDIRQAEAQLKQAIASIGIAEAQYYPSFQLAGQISIGSTGISGVPTTDILIASLGGLIEQFITDGGAREANVDIAAAQAQEALANYELALRIATEQVEASLAAIRASRQRQDSLEIAVASSERSFYQAETLYQQGLISFLDVVDAQRVLADAEQALAAERTNYATQIANLFEVLGTDVQVSKEI